MTIVTRSIFYLLSIFPRYDISLLKYLSMMVQRRNIKTEKYFVSVPFWEMAALSENIFCEVRETLWLCLFVGCGREMLMQINKDYYSQFNILFTVNISQIRYFSPEMFVNDADEEKYRNREIFCVCSIQGNGSSL